MRRRTLGYQAMLVLLVGGDLLWALGAYAAAFFLRIYLPLPFTLDFLPSSRLAEVSHPLLFLLLTQVALLYFFGFYDLQNLKHRAHLFSHAALALGVQLLATASWYFFRQDVFFPRSVLILFWLLNTTGVVAVRFWVLHLLGKAQPPRILLVGTRQDVRAFLCGLPELRPFPDVQISGWVSLDGCGEAEEEAAVPCLGSLDELSRLVGQVEADDVVLISPTTWKDAFVDRLLRLPPQAGGRPRVLVVPSVYDILVGRIAPLRLHDIPLVEVVKDPQEDLAFLIKGVLDMGIALILLVSSLPLLLLAALLIKLTSPGPIFYRQRRVGKGGKEFMMYKLRTMVDGAEEKTGPVLASSEDERVTWVGRWLRASRIDEIPQLLNVLNGTMSLVGPRPERPEFVQEFLRTIPGYAERLQVKPGLTGLAQVNGEYHTTAAYKLKYDLAYIYNYSLWLDIRILAETIKVMLTRRGV